MHNIFHIQLIIIELPTPYSILTVQRYTFFTIYKKKVTLYKCNNHQKRKISTSSYKN